MGRLASSVARHQFQSAGAARAGAEPAQARAAAKACAVAPQLPSTPAASAAPPPPAPLTSPATPSAPPECAGSNRHAAACRRRQDACNQLAAANVAPSASPIAPATVQGQAATVPASNGAGQVYGAANVNPRVILRARGDVRITVKNADGQMILNRDLKSGDSYQVPNMPGVTMATNDAGAVELDLDGIALGRAGQPQQVLGHVSLDPQPLADRFNNH